MAVEVNDFDNFDVFGVDVSKPIDPSIVSDSKKKDSILKQGTMEQIVGSEYEEMKEESESYSDAEDSYAAYDEPMDDGMSYDEELSDNSLSGNGDRESRILAAEGLLPSGNSNDKDDFTLDSLKR